MLIAVRHGSTDFNGEGERLRGWKNLSLSDKGFKEAREAASKVKSLKIPFNNFKSSDLLRAVQTSDEIKHEVGQDYNTTKNLRDWNIGEFSGKPVENNIHRLNSYINRPNEDVPGGESYNSFTRRVDPEIRKLVESDEPHLAVIHNRIMTRLQAFSKSKGEEPASEVLKTKGPVEPGGIIAVHPDWSMNIIKR